MAQNLCFWSMCDPWGLTIRKFTEAWSGKTIGRKLHCASQAWGTACALQSLNGIAVKDSSSPHSPCLAQEPSTRGSSVSLPKCPCQDLFIGKRGENYKDIFPTLTPYLSTPCSTPSPSQTLRSKKLEESFFGDSLSNIMNPKSVWIHLTLTRSHSLGKNETLRNSIYCRLASCLWSCGD